MSIIRALMSTIVVAAMITGGIFTWKHLPKAPPLVAPQIAKEDQAPATSALPEAREAQKIVAARGVLADYIADQKPEEAEAPAPRPVYKPTAEDHVEDSPVGTSSQIVKRTFSLARAVQFPFSIPAHAATPRLHGTFRSFIQQAVGRSTDEIAKVDLMLLNDEQYAVFSSGQDPEVVFATEPSDTQDVSFNLSPSQSQPVRYHLVFRNTPGSPGRKIVQADFTIDF